MKRKILEVLNRFYNNFDEFACYHIIGMFIIVVMMILMLGSMYSHGDKLERMEQDIYSIKNDVQDIKEDDDDIQKLINKYYYNHYTY